MSNIKNRLKDLSDRFKTSTIDEESKLDSEKKYVNGLENFVFPLIRSKFPVQSIPLRQNMDYQSPMRKAFLYDVFAPFSCNKCGLTDENESYVHSNEECAVAQVMLS